MSCGTGWSRCCRSVSAGFGIRAGSRCRTGTLSGILYVLYTGIQWEYPPQDLGFGSGMTCRRRLRDWNEAGLWQRLHEVLAVPGADGFCRAGQRPAHRDLAGRQ
ncbi:hypothetical protein Srubr_37730 [Streptomyces rubradiris]|uniref:Insertion element IS402-like domain-containing protein n=1 Tax=Streptomyces rubradiris TaxID=285531 RepID=A0ABQ3RDP3_STRRR|nr:hypothetical protein GCM10018792_75120 [Streptomyces rubradiris]GHI53927.1 hypothetical protein Srubr_37730 [Streptomyces rubradiris]